MDEKTKEAQIIELVEKHFNWKLVNFSGDLGSDDLGLSAIDYSALGHSDLDISDLKYSDFSGPDRLPFEISRENIHDSKADFLKERDTVNGVLDHVGGILKLLMNDDECNEGRSAMTVRLKKSVERTATQSLAYRQSDTSADLALQNIVNSGFFTGSLLVLETLMRSYENRLAELQDQEKQFWQVTGRPPNYYARVMALRVAKFYIRDQRKRPTLGTSRDGGHPSTVYGRVLEQVFKILDITCEVRPPGEWAKEQITDEEVQELVEMGTGNSCLANIRSFLDSDSSNAPRTPETAVKKGSDE